MTVNLEIDLVDREDFPVTVRPTSKTFQLEAGWPGSSPEAAIADLVEALNGRIQITNDADEKQL
ncbi:MAG: hypothetical protein ACLP0J_29185 [Solirubrobacteraceae bacterium]